jgi:hypothetical protein
MLPTDHSTGRRTFVVAAEHPRELLKEGTGDRRLDRAARGRRHRWSRHEESSAIRRGARGGRSGLLVDRQPDIDGSLTAALPTTTEPPPITTATTTPSTTVSLPSEAIALVLFGAWVGALADGDYQKVWDLLAEPSRVAVGGYGAFAAAGSEMSEGRGSWASVDDIGVMVALSPDGRIIAIFTGTVTSE